MKTRYCWDCVYKDDCRDCGSKPDKNETKSADKNGD